MAGVPGNAVDKAVQDTTRVEVEETALLERMQRQDKQMEEGSKARRKARLEKRIQAMAVVTPTHTTQCVYVRCRVVSLKPC